MPYANGFTLLELLLSLFLTALMVTGVAQYLTISTRIHLTIQQENLAAKTLEETILQSIIKNDFNNHTNPPQCPSNLDLPNFSCSSSDTFLLIEWQSPSGSRRIQRPFS